MNLDGDLGTWVEGALILGLVGSAVIHLLPVIGVVSVARLEQMYGASVAGPDLAVLMRHRAVLFGVLGGLLVAAVLDPSLRRPIVIATLVSDLAFLLLMRAHPGTTPAMARVLRFDLVSIALLVVAAIALVVDGS